MRTVTNVIFAGLGGQGVITASDILADAAFAARLDVKKSDVHGMAQRGGFVASEVRFGSQKILSPLIPEGEADFLVVLDETQVDCVRHRMRPEGTVLTPGLVQDFAIQRKRSANIALLALLSSKLQLAREVFENAMLARLKPQLHAESLELFRRVLAQVAC